MQGLRAVVLFACVTMAALSYNSGAYPSAVVMVFGAAVMLVQFHRASVR